MFPVGAFADQHHELMHGAWQLTLRCQKECQVDIIAMHVFGKLFSDEDYSKPSTFPRPMNEVYNSWDLDYSANVAPVRSLL